MSGHLPGIQLGLWFLKCFSSPGEGWVQSVVCLSTWFGVFCGNAPLLGFCVREGQGEGSNVQVRHKMLCSRGSSLLCLSSSQRVPALLSRCATPLGQTESAVVLEKLMMAGLPFLLRGFLTYVGWKPASTSEIRADAIKVPMRSSADTGVLKTVKLFLGKLLIFRSDLHIYTLPTCRVNPSCNGTQALPVTASSVSVQFPVVKAARSLVSVPVKSCQLSFQGRCAVLKHPLPLRSQSL